MSAERVEALAETVLDYEATCDSLEETTAEGYARAILASPVMRDLLAEAWFDGYSKGNLDGYFGTRDERAKSPYIDRDPYRKEQS